MMLRCGSVAPRLLQTKAAPLCPQRFLSSFVASADKYCREFVESTDKDHYLMGLLLSNKLQGPFFAVRSFNAELAMIKDNCRGNVAAGRIRFQWWQDALDAAFNTPSFDATSAHPVVSAIYHYTLEHNLSKGWFYRSLEQRRANLVDAKFDSLSNLESNHELIHSSLLYLYLDVQGCKDVEAQYICSHIGVSYGLVTLLRALAHPDSLEYYSVPQDIAVKYGVNSQILSGRFSVQNKEKELSQLKELVFDIAAQANGHLERAMQLFGDNRQKLVTGGLLRSENHVLPALLEAESLRLYLETLRQADFDPFSSIFYDPKYRLQLGVNLLRAKLTR